MVTATLLGVGVAGTAAATGDAALSHPRAATGAAAAAIEHPAAAVPQPAAGPATETSTGTTGASIGTGTGADAPAATGSTAPYTPKHAATPPGAAAQRSAKPAPPPAAATAAFAPARQRVRPAPAPQWVDPMPEARVTSCFGQRWGRLHAGVDLAAPHGTRIRAAGAGTVVAAGAAAGYGNAVLIDHANGYLTHYGHMSAITVQVGQRVTAGTQIGNEGSTGHSTGPHLHFEVHKGAYQNPVEPTAWLHSHGVDINGC